MKFEMLESDRRIWRDELEKFVPNRIFDAHSHVHDGRFAKSKTFEQCPKMTFAGLRQTAAVLFPGRKLRFLACGHPVPGVDIDGMNSYVAREGRKEKGSIVLMLVNPDFTRTEIEQRIDEGNFKGFKPYMCISKAKQMAQCTVLQMLPEQYWKIAHERSLVMLLHMGRYRALADPVNQRDIRRLAERYPRAKIQLAHCARCFTPEIAEKSLPSLADLPNVHIDTSAVCEGEVFHILFDAWPRKRIVFGTDNFVAGMARGKIAAFGLGWYTVCEGNTEAFSAPHVPWRPTFLAYENLRAIRYAAERKKWGRREREDFFWNNAARILKFGE